MTTTTIRCRPALPGLLLRVRGYSPTISYPVAPGSRRMVRTWSRPDGRRYARCGLRGVFTTQAGLFDVVAGLAGGGDPVRYLRAWNGERPT